MSHTTTLKGVQITNPQAVRRAVEDLKADGVNIELLENAVPRMYYASQAADVGTCEFVLKMPGSRYDVGLKWNAKEMQYDAVLDTWAGDISNQIGAACAVPRDAGQQGEHAIGRFTQRYGLHAAKMAAAEAGYTVMGETTDEDGNVHLQLAV